MEIDTEIALLTEKVRMQNSFAKEIIASAGKVILGSEATVKSLLLSILSGGNVLLEGMPGLAKTLLAKTFANLISAEFGRIQFTPDLLPADLTGGEILNPKTGEFSLRKGPLFTQILLADEINRAPAKVQSALLEAMEEKKISIARNTFTLKEPFMVLATQNPVEQEGTYPLPEAQMDRFMFKLLVDYPNKKDELSVLEIHGNLKKPELNPIVTESQILAGRIMCESIYADARIKDYIVNIVRATRNAGELDTSLRDLVEFGASPRASLALLRGAKANAFIEGRGFVISDDVKLIAADVLRHRILLSYNAMAEDIKAGTIIASILEKIEAPKF